MTTEQAAPPAPKKFTTEIIRATPFEGATHPCDYGCGSPILVGESVIRAVPTDTADGTPVVWAHELCYLRSLARRRLEELSVLAQQLAAARASTADCHKLLCATVAAANFAGRVRIGLQHFLQAEAAGYELAITKTPDGGKKLVLKRGLIVAADADDVAPAGKPS